MIKNYYLTLLLLCLAFSFGYGQVNENFDGWTSDTSYIGLATYNSASGRWQTNNALCDGTNSRSGRAIRFNDDSGENEYLLYSGLDGNGKDNGIGDISFWYRHWNGGSSNVEFQTQYSTNNGTTWVNVGGVISATSTTYNQFSSTLNLSGDNILIRVISIDDAERLMIDDFEITDSTTDPNLAITGTTNHGTECTSTAATTIQYTITNSGILPAAGVTVTSNDAQFVVTGLSSTTIAASGTATFDVTFTPSAAGAQAATITVASTTATSNAPTINLTGTGDSAPILTQPTDQNEVIPATATFDVTSANATSYQWQVSTNGGSTWANVTGGSGATTDSYTTVATTSSMDSNQYRCILTNACGITTSDPATLTLSNSSPSNAQSLSGCFEDTTAFLSWNNPATPPTGGYIIFAIAGTTNPTAPTNDANTFTANPNFNAAPFETPASLGKVVYKGTGTTATITGLTEGTTYSFRIFAYNGESLTGWSTGTSGGSNLEDIAQGDIRNFAATPLTNQVTLNWLNPTPISCWDDVLIVANQGTVSFTPTGNGSAYTANPVYSGANQVVYKGSGNSVAITGLTNGTNYCFRAYIRRGTTWTAGVEVCATPVLTYCDAYGNTSFDTGITGVIFNTINNTGTTANNAYTDYTAMSTTLALGDNHNLEVIVNIDGSVDVYTRVWIDWNQDGDFNGSGEQYDLGMDSNPSGTIPLNTATSNSPITIAVPNSAAIGATRMRVATKYNAYPTSCENSYSGEVEDYTIVIQQPTTAEINIEGNNISIPNGFNTPYGLNNTLFATTDVGSAGPLKNFFIENFGAVSLSLTGTPRVDIIGAHASDFVVTLQPSATVASSSSSEFIIQFNPTSDGVRTATVRIENSDSDEAPYLFDIEGTAICTTVLTSSIWPTEGPENTEVTITSANDLTGATATINGITMTPITSTATELIVLVPASAISGDINVLFPTGCSSINSFTVIDNDITSCETAFASTPPTDLFISEISDATTGSSSLIEIFNGTASPIDLSDYSIRVFNNGSGSPASTANLVGTLASGDTHVISLGTTTCNLTTSGLSGGLPHQTFNTANGINFNIDSSDLIELYNSSTSTSIDVFGVFGSDNWANGLGVGTNGINFNRQNTASALPSTTFNIAEWDVTDWTTCGDSDYSDFGNYDFSLATPPTVSALVSPTFNCTNTAQLSITGTEGVTAGLGLTYQWYYLAPNTTTYVVVPNNADFNNVNSATLDIVNTFPYNDYQFYCQVRENTATCFTASNAVKLEALSSTWDGTSWSTPPSIDRAVIIDGDYDTATEASFSGCSLVVNAGYFLQVSNGTYIEIENDIIADGDITVFTEGSVVQNNDLATVTANGTITVQKITSLISTPYQYTYWSSPVVGETIENVFSNVPVSRRFVFNAANFIDNQIEIGNTNTFTPGQDDIDDNGDDWQLASGTMLPGVGYAATANTLGMLPALQQFPFVGAFNNGVITPTVAHVTGSPYSDWNFIGNPYPSAIDTAVFFSVNSGTVNTIYLWSHATPENINASGNEGANFSASDYAIISGSGVNTAGGSGVIPNNFVPSGQGFFIETLDTSPITFNNAMRVTGDNDQFFRSETTETSRNVLWLNLSSDNGVSKQIAVAHLDGATDSYDGSFYDVTENKSSALAATFYSIISDSADEQFVIQGKDLNSLDLDEIIPLGFKTTIDVATLYTISIAQFEGGFYTNNNIYIKDNLLNSTHNLKESDYTFTSEPGEFNDRFEIVFTTQALSIEDAVINANTITIVELNDGNVEFNLNTKQLSITNVEILDVLGRRIYNFKGNSATEVYNLSKLSQAAYIAKITLSNGQIISKKAIKK
ncbi:choice-of-anchor D domain-containing protein [Winogradskyella litoriviva]|uniref:Choice-of-anchor D domain-containing protein n=1 Tax=Winogradskyella litoriviva TaxID=1220182 RepID=A0ABX2E0L7_9FLAO|nr:GEVED domain-containing protein [Winogradskyella litoriviva]NRD22025.1 choice-of-anchor D domain-containing protein [Winogradskyella litoriviva]